MVPVWIIQLFPLSISEFKLFYPKNCFSAIGNMIRVVRNHPGSGSFTHPGSWILRVKKKGTRSWYRIRNTGTVLGKTMHNPDHFIPKAVWVLMTATSRGYRTCLCHPALLLSLRFLRILIFTFPGSRGQNKGTGSRIRNTGDIKGAVLRIHDILVVDPDLDPRIHASD